MYLSDAEDWILFKYRIINIGYKMFDLVDNSIMTNGNI